VLQNPSTVPTAGDNDVARKPRSRGLTAVEEEALADRRAGSDSSDGSSDEDDDDEADATAVSRQRQGRKGMAGTSDANRISSSSYKKSGHRSQRPEDQPRMVVSSSQGSRRQPQEQRRDRSFGSLAAGLPSRSSNRASGGTTAAGKSGEVGEKSITFAPERTQQERRPERRDEGDGDGADNGRKVRRGKDRRSASGNTFRTM